MKNFLFLPGQKILFQGDSITDCGRRDAQHQPQALSRRKAGESLVDGRVEDDCRGAGHLVFRFLLARCGGSSGRNY